MLIVISPAKTLDFDKAKIVKEHSYPEFKNKAHELVKVLKKYTPSELMQLMNISDKLADLNTHRFKQWQKDPAKELARQAVCAFKGEVYTGLNVEDWTEANFSYSQNHLRILSGLYGVLRPLDYISAYRLEMGTKLEVKDAKNLYAFWDKSITQSINNQLNELGSETLINLASNEYFKSIKSKLLKGQVINPVFKDFKNGNYKVLSFYAKQARGMMTRYILKNELSDAEQIKEFNEGGYYYNDRLSKGNEWVFTRD